MPLYRFCLLDGEGRTTESIERHCADDLAALDAAQSLAGAGSIDVWDGKRHVLRLKQESPPERSDGTPPG